LSLFAFFGTILIAIKSDKSQNKN